MSQGFNQISLLSVTASKLPLQLQLHVLLASVFTSQAAVYSANCNYVEHIQTWRGEYTSHHENNYT